PHLGWRRGANEQEPAGSAPGLRLPTLRAVPPHDGSAERDVRPLGAEGVEGRTIAARGRAPGAGRPSRVRRSLPRPTLRRATSAGGVGSGPGAPAEGAPPRRTV